MAYAKGVDVSHWQSLSDWSPTGLSFVIVKASEGTVKDPMYDKHVAKGRAAGLVVGAYAFNRDDVNMDAQVATFAEVSAGADLFFIDVEGTHSFSQAQTAAFMNKFRALTGKHIGLYHSASGYFDAGQDYDWVAHWGVTQPSRSWDFHQYRGSPLDLDQYNGTNEALRAFVAALNGGTVNTFTTPKVPTICTVPKGAVLYKDDALTQVAWNIDPARDMPYYGEYETGKCMVQRTDESGTATGLMYFTKKTWCTNIRSVPPVVCPPPTEADCKVYSDAAYENGKAAGYEDGYSDGHPAGFAEGYAEGKVDGDAEGYDRGYDEGNADGYATGFSAGVADGVESEQERIKTVLGLE
jgi:hypothetical protein